MVTGQSLKHMQSLLTAEGWVDLEPAYLRNLEHCDSAFAADASAIDLHTYSAALDEMLKAGLRLAERAETRALYFEFDLDNAWQGNLFLCSDYQDESAGDDSWAGDWTEYVAGPSCEDLAALYSKTEGVLSRSPEDAARVSYLLARTLAAFAGAVFGLHCPRPPVAVAYHDQSGVFRL